jgi:TRAP-type mannitol/chloroaromatic compound transport system substrate-binding protein
LATVGNTGMQMGSLVQQRNQHLDDLKAQKIRMPGLGGEVLSRPVCHHTVNLPGVEVFTALQTSAIDATDWIGPITTWLSACTKPLSFTYPGQEPQAVLRLLINQKALDSLPADLQAILSETAPPIRT